MKPEKPILDETLLFCNVLLPAFATFAETSVSGEASGVWTKANSPYVIDGGTVIVPVGQTLTIQPGVKVVFPYYYYYYYYSALSVYGSLVANGLAVLLMLGRIRPTGVVTRCQIEIPMK